MVVSVAMTLISWVASVRIFYERSLSASSIFWEEALRRAQVISANLEELLHSEK